MVRLPPTLLLPVELLVPEVVALAVLCVLDALLFVAADAIVRYVFRLKKVAPGAHGTTVAATGAMGR